MNEHVGNSVADCACAKSSSAGVDMNSCKAV